MEKIKERLDLAIDWFLHSGIVNSEGGVYCWYDMEKDCYPFIYPEITAYAVSTFLNLNMTDEAVKSAGWLVNNAQYIGNDKNAKGGFFWKVHHPAHLKSKFIYSFDTSICISALVDLFNETGEQEFLDSANLAGNWLVNVMQNKNGSFSSFYNLSKPRYLIDDKWSRKPGPYHTKIAIGLLKLYNLTNNKQYKLSAENICNWSLRFDIFSGNEIYLHAHCYATEGFLYTAKELGDQDLEDTAIWYASKIADAQGPDGGIGRWCYTNGCKDQNTEATAQAVRLWIILSSMYPKDEFFHKNIEKGIDYLLSRQNLYGFPKAKGGFYYAVVDGKLLPHINTCATLFSIQALQMYLDWKEGKLVEPLRWLV